MLSVYRTLSLRYLSRRWFRALLIVASIALGVATLVATQALNYTMNQAALTAANPLAGIADLIISNDELPLSADLARELREVPGVASARPLLSGKVNLVNGPAGAEEREILVLGLDLMSETTQSKAFTESLKVTPDTSEVITNYLLARGLGQYPVLVGLHLAQDLDLIEDGKIPFAKASLRIQNKGRVAAKTGKPNIHPVIVVGAMEGSGDSAPLSGPVMVLDLEAAAGVLDYPTGKVQRIDVVLKPDTDPKEARAGIERVLKKRALVRSPQEQDESIQSVMRGMQTGFSLCGVAALVVGMFLVYNALSVSVAERRQEIGVLLSLGATKTQVWMLFAGEAALLGLAGAALGVPLGYVLANLGLGPMQQVLQDIFYTIEARSVTLVPGLIVAAVIVGVGTAVGAALVPALQAAREMPAEAVRRVVKAPSARRLILHISASIACVVIGATLVFLREVLPRRPATWGGLGLMMVGGLMAAPFLAALCARSLQPFIRRFFGIEWRLACDNLVRSPGRTGLVIGALAAGVALVVQTAGVILSNQMAINTWVEESIGADLIITSGGLVGSGNSQAPMDPALADRLRKIDGVEDVLPVRMLKVPFRETRVTVLAVEARRAHELESRRISESHARFYDQLTTSEFAIPVIASQNFAAMHGYKLHDTVNLPSPGGEVTLTIVAIIEDYTWNQGNLIINRADFLRHWNDTQVDVFDVYVAATAQSKSLVELEKIRSNVKSDIQTQLGGAFNLFVLTRAELQGRIRKMIEQIYGIAYGQQIVVMIVAALGVITALLVSVLQRRREMGLLRAIGASRWQVVYSVLCEAALMGLIGTAIGLVVGLPMQWYVLEVIILDESGFLFPMQIPWKQGLLVSGFAMLAATLAGLGPALYAVRQRIPDAIAYE